MNREPGTEAEHGRLWGRCLCDNRIVSFAGPLVPFNGLDRASLGSPQSSSLGIRNWRIQSNQRTMGISATSEGGPTAAITTLDVVDLNA